MNRETFNFESTGKLTLATLAYTSYLLQTSSTGPVEVAVAAVLPCFWIYREVGISIAKKTNTSNPYLRWIETYASEDFGASVEKAIHIFDEIGKSVSDEMRSQMVDAFYKSALLEWHFWDHAYRLSDMCDLTGPQKK